MNDARHAPSSHAIPDDLDARVEERVAAGDDEGATAVLVGIMNGASPTALDAKVATVEEWGVALDREIARCRDIVPTMLLAAARTTYRRLCASQGERRLLHGDLHHGNVLYDPGRGWLAIDPKGMIGERAYEAGAALRNPRELPRVFMDPATIERRVARFARGLGVDAGRIRAWAFGQAVLAVVWTLEDGGRVDPDDPWIELARRLQPSPRDLA